MAARIVSLLPSLTEIAAALGLGDRLVGRSHECDHPARVRALPACTEPKFEPRGSSADLDARVVALVREGLSVYRVDADRLRELAPDLILTQDHCQVCAASLRDVEAAVASWVGGAPRIVSVAPTCLAEVWDSVRAVADAAGAPAEGEALVARLTDAVTAIAERTGALPRPTVATLEWLDPLMTGGNWMPELVFLAGGRNLFGSTGCHSPVTAWEALRDADPDVLVVVPCGFDLATTRAEIPGLLARPGFAELRAARAGRVYLADGNAYFNRPGPRLVESLEVLAEILHPEVFAFGHEGPGFERLGRAGARRSRA